MITKRKNILFVGAAVVLAGIIAASFISTRVRHRDGKESQELTTDRKEETSGRYGFAVSGPGVQMDVSNDEDREAGRTEYEIPESSKDEEVQFRQKNKKVTILHLRK